MDPLGSKGLIYDMIWVERYVENRDKEKKNKSDCISESFVSSFVKIE